MAWSVPRYSRGQVDRAGELLVKPLIGHPRNPLNPFVVRDRNASEIVKNWRGSHLWPLYVMRNTLEKRATRIHSSAIISERIKRLESIEKKILENRHRNLKLTQIEDIGGCRAVLPTIQDALALAEVYARRQTKQNLHRLRDYISEPKSDGYRSIHLVFKYNSNWEQYKAFNGHRIEIQVRSQLQHAWATAVEMLWTFARVPLRLAPGQVIALTPRSETEIGKWRRFFALMASAMAIREGQPQVPGAAFDKSELKKVADDLNVIRLLASWGVSAKFLDATRGHYFLLQLDSQKKLQIRSFFAEQSQEAFDAYMYAEQSSPPVNWGEPPSTNVVLVSVDSVSELRTAYPNYYGDTETFVDALEAAIA
jgi:hypothetical protein